MIALWIMDLFYLDGYKTLWAKYHDRNREKYRYEREWAYANYKRYLHEAWEAHNFRQMINLRKAKKAGDYIWLYNLMIDWDGDEEGQILE